MCSVHVRKFDDFRLANVLLEMSVCWLSEDVVCFEITCGVYKKFAEM